MQLILVFTIHVSKGMEFFCGDVPVSNSTFRFAPWFPCHRLKILWSPIVGLFVSVAERPGIPAWKPCAEMCLLCVVCLATLIFSLWTIKAAQHTSLSKREELECHASSQGPHSIFILEVQLSCNERVSWRLLDRRVEFCLSDHLASNSTLFPGLRTVSSKG